MTTDRLDRELVTRGLVSSRTKAQRLISEGHVVVDGVTETKASREVDASVHIDITVADTDVGRGAKKLRHSLDLIPIPVKGSLCADVGASTGGFTQVLLEHGATQVIALDVGHDQLDPTLRDDPRVVNREGVSVLELSPQWWSSEGFPSPVDVVVADLSFISLVHAIPPMVSTFGVHSHYLVLVKPQFEVGRGHTVKGVVKDSSRRAGAVRNVAQVFHDLGVPVRALLCSPLTGEKGNVEYLMYASATSSVYPAEWDGAIPEIE